MQKITPFLWFNDNAEEAMNFYLTVFKNGRVIAVNRWQSEDGVKSDKVTSVRFEIEGQEFIGLNGGPHFSFTPAISMFVDCATQPEVDELWEKLALGGKKVQCGWVTDRFGLSWQVIPSALGEMLGDEDGAKAGRAWEAMMKMEKIDIARMKRAFEGER